MSKLDLTEEQLASELMRKGSVNAAMQMMHAAQRIAEEHKAYVVKYHKGRFFEDDNDIIQHWRTVAHIFHKAMKELSK